MSGFASTLLESGGDLLSRAVSSQVPSALKGLTSVFGMGTGGTPSPLPPEIVSSHSLRFACLCSPSTGCWPVPRHKPSGFAPCSHGHHSRSTTLSRHQPVGRFRVTNPPGLILVRMAFAYACPCSASTGCWPVPRRKPRGLLLVRIACASHGFAFAP